MLVSAAAGLVIGNASDVVALATGGGADVLQLAAGAGSEVRALAAGGGADVLALAVLAAALGAVLTAAVLLGSVTTGPAEGALSPLVGGSAGADSGPAEHGCACSSASGWMAEAVAGARSPRDCVLAGGAGTTTPADTSTRSLTGGDVSTLARG